MDQNALPAAPTSAFRPWCDVHAELIQESAHSAAASHFAPFPRLQPARTSTTFRKATVDLLQLYHNANPDFRFLESIPRRCLTKPSQPVHNNSYDNRTHDYILHVNDVLTDGQGGEYVVLDLLGTGTFGQVVKCRRQVTNDIVAVKVIKNQQAYYNQAWVEITILRILHRNSNDDTRHIVRFISHFLFRGHLCLVFEKLSINLYELLKQNNYVGVSLGTLRAFLTQILQALDVIVRSEVIHCDLKPENILLKSLESADLKLIDFGSACQLQHPVYSYVQSRFYRSPEVLLGLPEYDSKIDMWSLGCVAGELFLGIPLFPGQNEINMVSRIAEMLGHMPDKFLRRCRHTQKFFNVPRSSAYGGDDMHMFQLKSIDQFERENKTKLPEWNRFFKEKKLRDIIMTYPYRAPDPHLEETALRESLVDLLNGMLKIDPIDRWTPAEAMQHPFIRSGPLPGGQPWHPPARPRRMIRSRPMGIDAQYDGDDHGALGADGMYSASAPNLTGRGRFAVNPMWNTAAGEAGIQTYGNMHGGVAGASHMHGGDVYAGAAGVADTSYTPGSYVTPSTFSTYDGMSAGRPGGRGAMMGPNSYDPHAFLYPSAAERGRTPTPIPGGMVDTASPALQAMTLGDSVPGGVPFTPAMRFRSGLRGSGSRESLTGSGSLRMSTSRDSLGPHMGRVPSMGDLGEDPMFAFGSDDEAFATSNLQPGPPSAALPPLGLPGSRLGPAAYGQPSTLSTYGYTYTGQQTRSFDPCTGLAMEVDSPEGTPSPTTNNGSTYLARRLRPPQPSPLGQEATITPQSAARFNRTTRYK